MFLLSIQELDIISDIQSVFISSFSVYFSLVQQPMWGLGRLIVEVSKPHTVRHTQLVRLLWKSDQPVAEDWSYTTHNEHKTNNHAHSGFETHDPSNRAAANLRLRPHGHWDRLIKSLVTCIIFFLCIRFRFGENYRGYMVPQYNRANISTEWP